MSSGNDQLTELELRVATLIRKYTDARASLAHKKEEFEELLKKHAEQQDRIRSLEQTLSISAVTIAESPDTQAALKGLGQELDQITQVIDECITLLDSRVE
ncbi:MAG: hypothetical protein Q4E10_01855 [Porphyromonas sp.]|nr:hypothetical protein [Porphyromonas sp.]